MKYKEVLWPALLLALYVVLIFFQIGGEDIINDEAHTYRNIVSENVFQSVRMTEFSHPPLYFFLLKAWSSAFGDRVISLRLPSAIFGGITILSMFFYCRRRMDGAGAFFTALTLTTSCIFVFLCCYARNYALAILLTFLSQASLFDLFRDKESSLWAAFRFALWTALLLWTNYLGFYVLAVEGAWALCQFLISRKSARLPFLAFLGAAIAALVLFIPCYQSFMSEQILHYGVLDANQYARAAFISNPLLYFLIFTLILPFSILLSTHTMPVVDKFPEFLLSVPLISLVLIFAARGLLKRDGTSEERRWVGANAFFFIGLIVIPTVACALKGPYLALRFFSIALPSFCAVFGYGMARHIGRLPGQIVAAAMLLFLLRGQQFAYLTCDYGRPAEAISSILDNIQPGEAIFAGPYSVLYLDYYLHFMGDDAPPVVIEPKSIMKSKLDGALANRNAVWLFYSQTKLSTSENYLLERLANNQTLVQTDYYAFQADRIDLQEAPGDHQIDYYSARFEKVRPSKPLE